MSGYNSQEIQVMRLMAWQRAKGELNSILYSMGDTYEHKMFDKVLTKFMKIVDSNGLVE